MVLSEVSVNQVFPAIINNKQEGVCKIVEFRPKLVSMLCSYVFRFLLLAPGTSSLSQNLITQGPRNCFSARSWALDLLPDGPDSVVF